MLENEKRNDTLRSNELDDKNETIESLDVFPVKPVLIVFAEYQIWKSLIYELS